MTEQVQLKGIMDLDADNNSIQKGYHKYARNIIFRNNRPENIPGTREIAYTRPAGTNVTMTGFYDSLRQRVIWFNYNSNGRNGIYVLQAGVVYTAFLCYTHSTTDILNFDLQSPIHSINILYGDNTMGDILYFIDSQKRPTKINLTRALANNYGVVERSWLDVAKEPPLKPAICVYANDGTATVNNLRKALFQFRYSYVFDDKEESCLSTVSELALPDDHLDPNNDADPTKNAKVTVTLQTGKGNVKKIKLYVSRSLGNVFGDYKLIETFDKAQLSIADNSTYVYDFKNHTSGEDIELKLSTLLFSYVPREANTQEFLNGNILAYGGIKEGYAKVVPNVTMSVSTATAPGGEFDVSAAYNWLTKYKFGLVYFDEKGRTNGVVTSTGFEVTTGAYGDIPKISAIINHAPPSWGVSYQWVRMKNLTQSPYLYWVSETTYKDTEYAYIGIQNLYSKREYKDILTYQYNPGDRIKFIKLGATSFTGKDYEILDLLNSPTISGTKRNGFFIKIKLPTTGSGFDFGAGFANHFIELYTPSVNDKVYYEFGEAYSITNGRHLGGTQNQSTDLSTPALFEFTKGDGYHKKRTVPLGGFADYKVQEAGTKDGYHTIGVSLTSQSATNATYLLGSSPNQSLAGFTLATNDDRWIIKTVADAYTFRLKGSIKITSWLGQTINCYLEYSNGTVVQLVPSQGIAAGERVFEFDVTFSVPANTRVFAMDHHNENDYIQFSNTDWELINTNSSAVNVIDENFSDTFESKVNSNGRPHVVDDNGEVYNPTLIRYSNAYQTGTDINRTNIFYYENFDEYDRQRGDIQRFAVKGSDLFVFQNRGTGAAGIYQQLLSNADGSGNLLQSDQILSKIRYFQGDYGIGNQPSSLARSASAFYFVDAVRGYQVRLANDGFTPISNYKAQFYFPEVLKNYLTDYTTANGSRSKVIGVYDFFNEHYISVMQQCAFEQTEVYEGDTIVFDEIRNGYSSFYDFKPEAIICAETTLVSWKDGKVYVHDTNRNSFYGTSYPSKLTVVFTSPVKKDFTTIGYHSNKTWACPTITTSLGNVSNLVSGDFELHEDMQAAAFWMDTSSIGGLINGDYLKGLWVEVMLQYVGTDSAYITGVYINYLISQKNF